MSKLDKALDAARDAKGNTLLVLVSPRQAERLYVALQIADLSNFNGDLAQLNAKARVLAELIIRYKELA